jgi:hypothetical protein
MCSKYRKQFSYYANYNIIPQIYILQISHILAFYLPRSNFKIIDFILEFEVPHGEFLIHQLHNINSAVTFILPPT